MAAGQGARQRKRLSRAAPKKESFLEAVAGGRVKGGGRTSRSVAAPKPTSAKVKSDAAVVRKRVGLKPAAPPKISPTVLGSGATAAERRAFAAAPRSTQIRMISAGSAADRAEEKAQKRSAGISAAAGGLGVARAIGTATLATGASLYHDPVKQTGKLAQGVKDTVRGVAALPAAAYVISKELATEGRSKTGAKAIKGIADDYSRRYGPSFRGEPGALKARVKRQREEGSFGEILDLAPAGKVASAGAGHGARATNKALKAAGSTSRTARAVDRVAATTEKRAPLRVAGGSGRKAVTEQRVHRGLVGGLQKAGVDAARRKVQSRAVARAEAGKDPLSVRRAAVQGGEVTPILEKAARRKDRRRVAEDVSTARRRTQVVVNRELQGRKGPKDVEGANTLRQNFAALAPEQADAVHVATQLGIRSREAAERVLPLRIAKITANRDAADKPRTPDSVDNLPMLEAMLTRADLFDDPEVRRVADVERDRADRMVGSAQGLGATAKAQAVYAPLAETLGVVKREGESVRDYTARMADELGVHRAAHEDSGAYRRRLTRAVDAARKSVENTPVALHRRSGEKVRDYTARLAGELRLARQENETEPAFRKRLVAAAVEHRAKRVDPARTERRKSETDEEYLARVQAAAYAHGLVAPGYRPSWYNEADGAPPQPLGGLAGAGPSPGRARSGENFAMGRENTDPRLLEKSLTNRVRFGANEKARTDLLRREGIFFATKREAEEFQRKNHMSSSMVVPVERGVTGQVPPSAAAHGDYVQSDAHYVVPDHVVDEFRKLTEGSNVVGRGLDRAQGLQSATLLASSPSWIQFQALADGSAAAAAGGLHRVIHNNRLYKNMSDSDREAVDVLIAGHPMNDTMLWDADAQVGKITRLMEKTPGYEQFLRGRNPLTALLKLDAAKSSALRRSALIQRLAVDAKTGAIEDSVHALQGPQRLLRTALTKADPAAVSRLLRDKPELAEDHASHVAKIMGDFANYTAAERAYLRRFVPFYGFLRYATRLSLYTLPVEHPVMGLLIANLGRLSAEESKDVVGPDLPYGLAKFYNADGTKAVDLQRMSPVMSQLFQIDKPSQLIGLAPPIANIVANQVAGKNIYRDRAYHVGGSLSEAKNLTKEDRARIMGHELFNLLAFQRANEQTGPQVTDDSLPWDPRPVIPIDPDLALSVAKSAKQRPSLGQKLFPLASPLQPDTGREQGDRATKRKTDAADQRRKLKARQTALRTDPVAQAIQQTKILKAEAKQVAEAALPPEVAATLKKINDERAALGLPPLRR